jgi:hypothetical protein
MWCYAVTRVIAERNNYAYGVMSPEKFKGREFMDIDFGNKVAGGHGPEGGPPSSLPDHITNYYKEKMVWHPLYRFLDITPKDDTMLSIQDNTKIDPILFPYTYLYNNQYNWLNESLSNTTIHDDIKHIGGKMYLEDISPLHMTSANLSELVSINLL